ncbi:MAG: bifunctional oligoribonuclease/PAP phosphatase NrnA, partial [Candidatus Omnitrophota bacterium]
MRKIFKDIKKILQAGDTFLITTHINPDGDGIGSAFAMDYLLKMLGKKTVIVCQDSVPHDFAFFGKEWIQYKEGIEIP